MYRIAVSLLCVWIGLAVTATAAPLRVLYLTKSAGYEHGVVKREGDALSFSEKEMTKIVEGMGGTVECTKDAGLIKAENLKNYDLVIFCTTGDLTTTEGDGSPAMGENGLSELLDWIKAGGGFIGYHNANDTFHSGPEGPSPYIQMLGGEFATHGQQFKGELQVVSPKHPAIKSLKDCWRVRDEWYISKHLDTKNMHVLALLNTERARRHQEKYRIPSYPIIWCKAYGEGRVLYNAMGHREDVWNNPDFHKLVIDNINWAVGKSDLNAEPNYDKVVPKTIEESDKLTEAKKKK